MESGRNLPIIPTAATAAGLIITDRAIRGFIDESQPSRATLIQGAVGRSFDLLDGFSARALGQETVCGAAADAIVDKYLTTRIVYALHKTEAAPKLALGAMVAQHAITALATLTASVRSGEREKTSATGKLSMFVQHMGAAAYAAAKISEREQPHSSKRSKRLRTAGNVLTFFGVGILGTISTAGYVKKALKPNN